MKMVVVSPAGFFQPHSVTTKALLIIRWGFHHDNVNQGITILIIKKYMKAINLAKWLK